ncbi:leucine-rich repeat protein [uncultured Merdimonas sp.]|uniref:leucine-rich repeat protein n=1 Tax=uncultured Merdimonas sp. TaxID=2023269 RepID=UPI003209C931
MKRRRLFACFLAILLSLCMAMPTFAAEVPQETVQVQAEETDQNLAAPVDQETVSDGSEDSSEDSSEDASADASKDVSDAASEEQASAQEDVATSQETSEEAAAQTAEEAAGAAQNDSAARDTQSVEEAVVQSVDDSIWSTEDFVYTTMEQTLNGCDYTREFTIKGKAIAGFSEYGLEKVKTNKHLVLPSTDDNGETLVGVAEGAFKNMELESVEFPTGMMVDYDDTVTHVVTRRGNFVIGSSAFYGNNLTKVYLPEGVIAVMPMAFSKNQITELTLPHTIWWIENQAFATNQLTTVGFPRTCDFQLQIHALAFAQNQIKSVRLPDYTEVVEKKAFYWNPGMEECPADAPEKEKELGGVVYMYTDNEDLLNKERIHTIDRTAESQKSWHQKLIVGQDPNAEATWTIEDFTIEGTTITGLSESGAEKRKTDKNLILPDRNATGDYITEVASTTSDTGLFATEEEKFESVTLPTYLEKVGDRAFCNSGLQTVKFPNTLKEIGIAAFQRNELTSIVLPDSVTTLGGGAFGTNPKLTQIVLSKGLTEIPAGAFGCSTADEWMAGLTSIEIPEGVVTIANNAFAGNNFTEINLPSTVKEIGDYAFSTKNYLKDTVCTITLPEGLTTIGKYAFRNKIVETLELPESVEALPANVFTREYSDDTQAMVTTVYVSAAQIADKENFPESQYHTLVLRYDPENTVWDAHDFTYGEVEAEYYDVNKTETVKVEGWAVTGFSENGLKKLAVNPEIVIPSEDPDGRQVTAVAANAFKYDEDTMAQKITSVTFPENVKTAYQGALSQKTERGNFLILSMAFYGQGLTEVVLPEGVLSVGRQAFAKNALTYVKLPQTIWWLEQGAFASNAIHTVQFPTTCDFKLNMDAQVFMGNQIRSVALPDRVEKLNKWVFIQNTGKEEVTTGTAAEKKGGVVYMYGPEALASEALIDHIDNGKSNVQKLVIGTQEPAEQFWNPVHFTYDGTTITGLSDAGKERLTFDTYLRIPDQTADGKDVTAIGNNAFAASGITAVQLPKALQTIGTAAFRANEMTEVVIPDSVTSIASGAFTSCASLESVTLPKGITSIEQASFSGTALKEVLIPEGVTTIGRMAFNGAPVEILVIPNTVTEIGDQAFYANHLTELIIPASVKSIGKSAFSQYPETSPSSLEKLTLNEGLESIASAAFRKSNLTTVNIPSTLKELDKDAFQDGAKGQVILYTENKEHEKETPTFIPVSDGHKVIYTNLIGTGWEYDDFTFDGSVVTGWSEQGNQTRLANKNLVLPAENPETGEAITEIGENAFKIPDEEIEQLKDSVSSPNGMETVVIPDTVTRIGKKAFEYNNFTEMTFGAAVTEIGESAFHGNKLTKVVIPDTVTTLGAGVFSENNITDLTLSRGVTVIPQGAFSMNIRLEQVTIPDTVTEIGEMAFAGARLISLEIPASVEKIGRKAFHLHHLTELTIPGNVKEIGESAFEGTFKAITLKKLTLEEGIESIGKYAFKEGYLESVELPSSLKEMGEEPFYGNAGTNGDHVVVCYTSNKDHLKFGDSASHKIVYVYEETGLPYEDVSAGEWYYDAVKYAYEHGLMTGLDDTTFGPNEKLARAQLAVILYRLNGSPEVEYDDIFPDVPENEWYTNAVIWAQQNGIVTGYTNTGEFKPGNDISRQEITTMMHRYAEYKGYSLEGGADYGNYPDAAMVADYAKEAMSWAVGNGIISGKTDPVSLDPQGETYRSECATIIMRFAEAFE